jgi:hypothetical protein
MADKHGTRAYHEIPRLDLILFHQANGRQVDGLRAAQRVSFGAKNSGSTELLGMTCREGAIRNLLVGLRF